MYDIYGISQNPYTNDYIVVVIDGFNCESCGKQYRNKYNKWCNPYQLNCLKNNFTNWTSRNEKIDDFIQKKQLKINEFNDIVFGWIPYDQFSNIKKLGKSGLVYSAEWKGDLYPLTLSYH